ncbi:glycosyltransferase family 4 protein [Methanogenium organophilum]|uniref:Glycosyltransferase family 4 protein n=1 Tax=Methanogenium organophilum TaxID=2199 RepID=A0A9X9S373_METOG|nr:glycosyltransferase family 4 protein [Methanogenium organophilum]WAI00856.1 glycosyltransferase family 4 protein [Methanogenium organophilum]
MPDKNLLVIANNFPNRDDSYTGQIFVKEQLKYLKANFHAVYVISPVAFGIEKFRKTTYVNYTYDNVRVFFPKYLNIPIFFYYGKAGWLHLAKKAIFDLIQKEQISIDVIHAHFTWPAGALAIECKKKYDVPVVITEHASTTFERAIATRDHAFLTTWEFADSIIRVKEGDISDMYTVGIDPQKIRFIPNGFDAQKFYPMDSEMCKQKVGLPHNKKIILYVGNLYTEIKGHKYLVDAVAEIVKQRQDILIIIIGSGSLKNTIETQIHSLGLEEYITLAGRKLHGEIPLWMNACDLFVLPSLKESFGIVQLEALACGKPVVATRNGGSEEVITSDEYGLLVSPGDAMDLAGKILVALDREWNTDAILTYAQLFTWEHVAKEIMGVYEHIMRENV